MKNMLHEREIHAEGRNEGIAIGERRGSNKMMNIMLELMRKTGISQDQINAVKAELNDQQIQALLSSSID